MQDKKSFAIASLIAVLLINGAIIGAGYYLAPEAYSSQFGMMLGVAGLLSLLLWLIIVWMGGKAIAGATAVALASRPTAPTAVEAAVTTEPETIRPEPVPIPDPEPAIPQQPDETPAVQMLAILQRKGRLIDFLQEDLAAFEDAQIGAAVRTVHEGCNQALAETVTLEPVLQQPEGSTVTIEADFDSKAIRLVGGIVNDPPFDGVLRHKGWRIADLRLPERTGDQDDDMIVAAAEVEV